MKDKRAQGMSLNVIIIAVLALVILVVLVAIFTGRIGIFEQGVSKEGQAELVKLRLGYGKCHPSESTESAFLQALSAAGNAPSLEEQNRLGDEAKTSLRSETSRCKTGVEQSGCEAQGCSWG